MMAVAVLAPRGAVWLATNPQERLERHRNITTRAEGRQGPAVVGRSVGFWVAARRDKTSDSII